MPRPVILVPYNPAWAEKFENEAAQLKKVLGPEVVAIHHIGSTAIGGIKAKPVIDILPEVRDLQKIDAFNESFAQLGYVAYGEHGIPLRRFFTRDVNGERAYHVHVFQTGNPEITRHLNFRNYLRTHPAEAQAYEAEKEKLAIQFKVTTAYAEAKGDFVHELDRRASEWQAQLILHIVPANVYHAHDKTQPYTTESLTTEGFIHCTKEPEVMLQVANRFYKKIVGDVLILVIDPQKVIAQVKYEPPAHPEPDPNSPHNKILFPHIYGALNWDAVVDVRVAERASDGSFIKV